MEMPGQRLRKNKAQWITPLTEGAGIRLAEVSEPDLSPGVSFQYKIGQVGIRSEGLPIVGCTGTGSRPCQGTCLRVEGREIRG